MNGYQYRTTEMREQRERKIVATARSSIWKRLLSTACITLLFSPSFAWNSNGGQLRPWRKTSSPYTLLAASPRNDASSSSSSSTSRSDDSSAAIKGVTLKIALDANGGAADLADTKLGRFTSPESLDMVHRLRVVSDAVLVGRGTVQEDDCTLTVRRVPLVDGRPQPIRVVLDPRLSLLMLESNTDAETGAAKSYKMFEDGLRTVVYHSVRDVDYSSLNLLDSVTCVYLPSSAATETPTITTNEDIPRQGGNMSAKDIVQDLAERFNVHHLMVEGGPATAKLFLREEVVDRVILVRAPLSFRQPLDAGITSTVLETAGLQFLGLVTSENVDQIECWSRPGSPWPTEELGDWP